jgi:hypothetical protein
MTLDDIPDGPDPAVDPPGVFSTKGAAMVLALKKMVTQLRTFLSTIGIIAGGSANKIPYWVDLSSTTMADPGAGKIRLNNAAQNAATALALDLLGSDTVDYTGLLGTFGASTSPVLGQIRIEKLADASKFLLFNLSAVTSPSGYRQLTVVCVQSSSATPFVDGDAVVLSFSRTGDRGLQGQGYTNMIVATSTVPWQPPPGTTKARITVQDGGYSSSTSTSAVTQGGRAGNAGISIITVDPAVTYTATVGAGGSANASNTNAASQAGGASTFSGSGITTLTSANAALKIPGGPADPVTSGFAPAGGSSMLGPQSNGVPTGYGCGAGGSTPTSAGNAGANGAVIIEY